MATKKPDPEKTDSDAGEAEAEKPARRKSGFAGIAQLAQEATSTKEIQAALVVLCNELDRIIKDK